MSSTPGPISLSPANISHTDDGTPYAAAYDDVYHAAAGGLAQARQVFIAGNDLPQRWQERDTFTIVETGFGLGLNFLATWQTWQHDPQHARHLHFVSVEKHPPSHDDLLRLHAAFAELAPLSAALRAQWPLPLPGCHRLHFTLADGAMLTLTLAFGDAQHMLPKLVAQADAFYLDGFSPAKNPELWSADICRALAKLAVPQATLATWSVASEVRRNLGAAGFAVEKCAGFADKRQMLRGRYQPHPNQRPHRPAVYQPAPPPQRHALIIGAGFAGSSVVERLAARGWQIDLIDAVGPGGGASGNRVGVLRPLPSADDNRLSRLTRAACLYTRRHLERLDAAGRPLRWGASGVLHLARDAEHEAAQQRAVARLQAPPDYLRYVDREEAGALAGWPVERGGWWFPSGGWGSPPTLCAANLDAAGPALRRHFGSHVARIEYLDQQWHAFDDHGQCIAAAPLLLLANAADARRLAGCDWLPLRAARGQTTLLPAAATPPLDVVVCRQGYVTPALDGERVCGASFIVDDADDALRPQEHVENLAKLDFILPGFINRTALPALEQLTGRVGFRPVSNDRLPMLGPLPTEPATPLAPGAPLASVPRRPGLWLVNGFGARGLVWSALAGELVASWINGEPLLLESDLVNALDPARFLLPGKQRPANFGEE